MKNADLLIKCEHIYTMEGEGVGYLSGHGVAVAGGKIAAVLPWAELEQAYTAPRTINAENKVLLPGFIDGHMHTGHGVLRGVAQDIANWMMDGVAPFERQRSPEAKTAGSKLAIAEAVMNGTTTIGDDGSGMAGALAFIDEIGARGNVSIRIREAAVRSYRPGELYEFDEALGQKALDECLALYDRWHGHDDGRIQIRFGPQGADFLSLPLLQRVRELARERKTKIHMHLSQGSRETKQMTMRYGKKAIPMLAELGYLDEDFVGIHLTDATAEEVAIAAGAGASMILCSASIGVIDGEVPPAKEYLDAGGRVGLGSDQAPGNNCHNMIHEMYTTALFNKIRFQDPEIMPAWQVLRLATIENAKALGIDAATGSIKAGKDADLILIDLHHASLSPLLTVPMRNFVPNLVYSARGDEVDTVMVKGRLLMEGRKPLTFDLDKILAEVQGFADEIGALAAPEFEKIDGKNARYMKERKL
ncbi:amidohydrolase family protein [Ruminococcaceae bacterium OttesenSCG-928-D13]|nr:amidohydrolase family protein [Ruminococcaceae bacterium OttesenSCG-928-D13]